MTSGVSASRSRPEDRGATVPVSSSGREASALDRVHRVLIVDDTPDIRELLALILGRTTDFSVVGQAADGRAGLAAAERDRPDVVLLDMAMPVMDGLEALPGLRTLLPHATIVVLSGFGTGAIANQAFAAGADAYVEKGTSAQRIVERVREAVAGEHRAAIPSVPAPPPQPSHGDRPGARTPGPAPPETETEPVPEEVARLHRAIATTAHEIRNPVTVLRGVLEAFSDEAEMPRDRQDRLLTAVGRQIQQLDAICTDLLTAAHARRSHLEITPRPFDLLGALREIIGERPDVTLRHDAVPALPVVADRGRLEQMVLNLLTNADKYGAPPVEVHARRAGSRRVEISVSDEGPGVSAGFRDRLFDEFARADTAARIAGNGLGLFVVRRLAQAHGGDVRYADRAGGGAVFTIDVPTGA